MNRTKKWLSFILNLVCAILAIGAAIYCYTKEVKSLYFLVYYTEQSNVILGISCLFSAAYALLSLIKGYEATPNWVKKFKYISTCLVFETFMIVVLVLGPFSGIPYYKYFVKSGLFHHLICPLMGIGTLLVTDEVRTTMIDTLIATSYTFVYGFVYIILNLTHTIKGPYFFLEVYNQPVYMSIIWCIVVLGFAYGLCFLLHFLNKKINQKANQ